jgi:hypothetical protein
MKLYGTIAVHVQAVDILRAPGFFDKVRRAFGGKPDLRTGNMRSAIEATALVEASRDALRKLGATDAISLVIDGTVLFHDRDSKPDDLGDLFLAFADNESVFGEGFDEMRLAVEHREAGLHIVIEIQARPVHARSAPAIRVIVSGRIEALTPRPGEDAASYRARAEPIAGDAKALEVYRVQFEAFVERVRDAMAAAMPTARVEIETAEARVVRPDAAREDGERALSPAAAAYDPYVAYYPSPLGFVGEALLWSSLFSMAMPPHYVVVDHHNHVQGFADDPGIESGPTQTAAEAGDGGNWWADNETGDAGDGGHGGDSGDSGGDGGGWSDDGGGGGGDMFGDGGGDLGGGFGSDDW